MHSEIKRLWMDQIHDELSASHMYINLANTSLVQYLPGLSHFMYKQSAEERQHADTLIHYLFDLGETCTLGNVETVSLLKKPEKALDIVSAALTAERHMTKNFRTIYETVISYKEYEHIPIVLEFLQEQLEEEKLFNDLQERYLLANNDPSSLLLIDQELAARE